MKTERFFVGYCSQKYFAFNFADKFLSSNPDIHFYGNDNGVRPKIVSHHLRMDES